MSPPLQRRIEALEHPHGQTCLCCELAKLNGKALAQCAHPAGNSLADALRAIDRKELGDGKH